MSSSDDEAAPESMETGRVSRYFLYRNRERQPVRRPQLKTVLDQFRERSHAKRRDPVKEASTVLRESLGLTVACPDDKAKKLFLVRTRPYPPAFPIPFSPMEKAEYGLLTFVFFIVHFKGDEGLEIEPLRQNIELNTGVHCDSLPFGKWPDIITKWASQDYLKLTKKESPDPMVQKKVVTLGPRFHAEFGLKLLRRMAKELIFGQVEPEEEEEVGEKKEGDGEGEPEPEAEGEPEPAPEPEPERRRRGERVRKRRNDPMEQLEGSD
jgi:hypothetical protein